MNLIEFSPNEGTLYSNEKALISCIFSPVKQRDYDFKIPVTIKSLPICNGMIVNVALHDQ